jgi:hypothetical protein
MFKRLGTGLGILAAFSGCLFLVWDGLADDSTEAGTAAVILPPDEYLGVAGCDCHAEEDLGRQVARWAGSHHARTYLLLETGYPERVDPRSRHLVFLGYGKAVKQEAERLGQDQNCLECHGTGFGKEEIWSETFHVEDGVQCEACHGPGRVHVALLREEIDATALEEDITMKIPEEQDCLKCHREKPSHAVVPNRPEAFDFQASLKKIAHPME